MTNYSYTYSKTHPLPSFRLENYELISSTHCCEHADEPGEPPFLCYKDGVESCLQQCDRLSLCVGYSENDDYCLLFPSDGLCPSEWDQNTGSIAASSNQVVVGETYSGWNCNRVIGMDKLNK